MRNYYKDGYMDCINAILKEVKEHKEEISLGGYTLIKDRLIDLFLVKETELDDYIESDKGTEDKLLSEMRGEQ